MLVGGWQARRDKDVWGCGVRMPLPACAALGGFALSGLTIHYLPIHVLWVVQGGFG